MNDSVSFLLTASYVDYLAQSVEVPLGPVWEIINLGGGLGVAFLVMVSLLKGWLVIGKSAEDRLEAERSRAEAAERREKWWQELAIRQGALLPTAVRGFEEATVIALEQRS